MPYPVIETDDCIGCGACVDVCTTGTIDLEEGYCTVIDEDACLGCGECMEECPMGAITEIKEDY